ncbi:MAG: hypothetical protein PHO27_00100 [Sulfuricurvum sp.]|nr:hypothetical protein [Sulfuricurvum sp.]
MSKYKCVAYKIISSLVISNIISAYNDINKNIKGVQNGSDYRCI